MRTGNERIILLDVLRGVAVVGIILYHFLFDLNFFGIVSIELYSGFWFWFARAAAFTFVFLAGLSCVLYTQRREEAHSLHLRGLTIFAWGLLITLITYLTFPEYVVWFGALHLIGLGISISPFFVHRMKFAIALGFGIFGLGIFFSMGVIPFPPILPLFPVVVSTFDYFPLFPWLGAFLLGIGTAKPLIHQLKKATPSIPFVGKMLQWAGKNSLMIYLVHQPILVGILLFLYGV